MRDVPIQTGMETGMAMSADQQTRTRVAILAPDLISTSGLQAILENSDDIVPVAQFTTVVYGELRTSAPDVLLWDIGWSADVSPFRDSTARDDQGRIDGVPVLGLVSDASLANMIWRVGVRSILLRSIPTMTLISALLATANGLWTLSPQLAEVVPVFRTSTASSGFEPLTKREHEVLNLVADGLTNRGIAQKLAISEHTVKFHVNSILSKLDAESRTDAVVRATRAGVLLL